MSDLTNKRKIEHIEIVDTDKQVDRRKFYFDDVHLKHRALPELDLETMDPSITFLGKTLSFPLLISSMTGGDHELIRTINRNLAIAAEETQVAMGVGSQRVMFTHPESSSSFALRQYAPNTLLFANLGAVQLNYGVTVDMCKQAIDVLQADALYLHLNPLQEAVQPEGDTNFTGLADKIGALAEQLTIPVVLKEVGAGISREDAQLVMDRGVKYVDVAGSGGTSWSRIEHHRQTGDQQNDMGIVFQDWGIPTPAALKQLRPLSDTLTLIASGGIRTGVDMAKAMVLGASLCGLASPFLKPAMESPDKVIETIMSLKREFTTAMFLLGQDTARQLVGNDNLLLSE